MQLPSSATFRVLICKAIRWLLLLLDQKKSNAPSSGLSHVCVLSTTSLANSSIDDHHIGLLLRIYFRELLASAPQIRTGTTDHTIHPSSTSSTSTSRPYHLSNPTAGRAAHRRPRTQQWLHPSKAFISRRYSCHLQIYLCCFGINSETLDARA